MNPNVTKRIITLNANGQGGQQEVNLQGTCLTIISATGTFQVAFDGGSPQDIEPIIGINLNGLNGALLPSGQHIVESFKRLTFIDTSGAANTIKFYVSNAPITFQQLLPTSFVKDAPAFIKTTALVLADGGNFVFNGVGPAGQQRKAIIVQNRTDGGNVNQVYVTDGNNTSGTKVLANDIPYTFPVSGSVTIRNVAGSGNTTVYVTEIFYS